ncbi:mobilization protein [Sulfitobacter sp.]|uniref:mobilization protein n=1 Tax=Sulfitobacter sp. TaxID=1903071 RepID=UPI003002E46B
MVDTALERAEKRFTQAKALLQGIRNREATKQRKMDTRHKVILGGVLLDLAGRDSNAAAILYRLMRNLPREQDQKAFVGWEWPWSDPCPAPLSYGSGSDQDGTS